MDITESRACTVPLDREGAAALERLGEQLVSRETWWGDSGADIASELEESGGDGGTPAPRSAIRCTMGADGQWRVRVANRIGVVSVGDLQLRVLPKLPHEHVMEILRAAPGLGPSLTSADSQILTESGGGFWEVLAHSFVWATERLFRGELIRDYQERRDELTFARGRIRLMDTTRNLMRGRMLMSLEYEDFTIDIPLNRMLRAAARRVAANPIVGRDLRQRALRLVARTEGVGELREGDVRLAHVDRRTAHYRGPIGLARLLLKGETVSWVDETVSASAFLVRTPDLVELGIRRILDAGLRPTCRVRKGSLPLRSPAGETINPDLIFGSNRAVGDVKYKLAGDKWSRPDVYEVVAFASHVGTNRGAIVDFAPSSARRPDVIIGSIEVRQLAWDLLVVPSEAAIRLVSQAEDWLLEDSPSDRDLSDAV